MKTKVAQNWFVENPTNMVFLVNRYLAIFVLYKEEYKLKPNKL